MCLGAVQFFAFELANQQWVACRVCGAVLTFKRFSTSVDVQCHWGAFLKPPPLLNHVGDIEHSAYHVANMLVQRGRLKRSARAVQLFGRLAVLETHTLRY